MHGLFTKGNTICDYPVSALVKVTFSNESGQNLNCDKPTQYDGRSHVKSG